MCLRACRNIGSRIRGSRDHSAGWGDEPEIAADSTGGFIPVDQANALRPGQVVSGPLFSEPMRVETVRANGAGWTVGLVGVQTEKFRNVTLGIPDLARLTIRDAVPTYDGDGRLLRLGLQAYSLGIA